MTFEALVAIAAIVAAAIFVRVTVGWVMGRFDVQPAAPEDRSEGFRDVLDRLRERSRAASSSRSEPPDAPGES